MNNSKFYAATACRPTVAPDWSRNPCPFPDRSCIHELFQVQVRRSPEALALVCRQGSITYGELNRQANAIAFDLLRRGVEREDLVGLWIDRSPQLIAAMLGVLKAGCAYLALDRGSPRPRLERMLEESRRRWGIVQWGLIGSHPFQPDRAIRLGERLEASAGVCADPALSCDPAQLAYAAYTSGSSGGPKGVLVDHRAVVRLVCGADYARFGPDEVFLHLAPASFDASVFEIWGPLLNGSRLALMPPGTPSCAEIAQAVRDFGVSSLWLPAGLFSLLAEEGIEGLSGVTQLVTGGDVVPAGHVRRALQRLPGCRLVNGYGPTENTTFTCCHGEGNAADVGTVFPIGKPIANSEAFVLDGVMRRVSRGVAGELYAGGAGLARGYLKRPRETAESFLPHPFASESPGARLYRTGDRVRWGDEGAIEFLGRFDEQLKIRGFRVEPREVEAELARHPSVRQCLVLGESAAAGEARLIAYVQPNEEFEAVQLRSYLARRLPDFMLPGSFVQVERWPLTGNGKIDRRALPAPATETESEEAENEASVAGSALASIWRKVLGTNRGGFLESGGHSLAAVRMASRVRRVLGVEVPLALILQSSGPEELAQEIARLRRGEPRAEASLENPTDRLDAESERLPLSFSQERIWLLERMSPGNLAYNTQISIRFRGRLRLDVLERSLTEIVRRHESLRTTFPSVNGRPRQRIHEPWRVTVPIADLSRLTAPTQVTVPYSDPGGTDQPGTVTVPYSDPGGGDPPRMVTVPYSDPGGDDRPRTVTVPYSDPGGGDPPRMVTVPYSNPGGDPPRMVTVPYSDPGGTEQPRMVTVPIPEPSPNGRTACENESVRAIRQAVRRPFDLQRLPLLRWTLLRLSHNDHILVESEHHLVHDGWSLSVLLRELQALYSAFAQGLPSPLEDLEIQFAQHAEWERRQIQGAQLGGQPKYWKERLKDAPPFLEMPADRPRPEASSFLGGVVRSMLGPDLCANLREFCEEHSATPFMVMTAAFQVLLFRYTGQTDLVTGTAAANRLSRQSHPLIGMLVNNLALRADFSGDPPFETFLKSVRTNLIEAFARQDFPFEKLVEALQPPRSPSRNPVVQALFSLHDSPMPDLDLPDVSGTLDYLSNGSAKFDLSVIAIPVASKSPRDSTCKHATDGSKLLIWEYDSSLFHRARIERMTRHYGKLLEVILAVPARRISELNILEEDEREQLLAAFSGPVDFPQKPLGVRSSFREWEFRAPDLPAVFDSGRRFSYGDLGSRARMLSGRLRQMGAVEDELVAICLEPSAELVISMLAALFSGSGFVCLDPNSPDRRIVEMLEDCRPRALLARSHQAQRLGTLEIPLLEPDQAGGETLPNLPSLDGAADGQALAYAVYTSGSSGKPKAAAISHQSLANLAQWHSQAYGIRPGDRLSQLAGPAFDASIWEIWSALYSGASLHIAPWDVRRAPERLIEWLQAERIDICFLPTPMAEAVITRKWPQGGRPRALLTGGDRLHGRAVEQLPAPLYNHYGPSENAVVSTVCHVDGVDDQGADPPIGLPIPGVGAFILDDAFNPSPTGIPGQLCLSGEGLARGYLGQPSLTAASFVPNPFRTARNRVQATEGDRLYKTGDLVRRRPDGRIEFLGRIDRQVKIRGFRIELGEIESLLMRHSAVRQAAALAVAGRTGHQEIRAFAVPNESETSLSESQGKDGDGKTKLAARLLAYLRERLPSYMTPSNLRILADLPLTANGKVDSRALAQMAPIRESKIRYRSAAPLNDLQRAIAEIWQESLQAEVGIDANFFDLGGHSLLLAQLHGRLEERLDRKLSLTELYRYPTIRSLSAHLADGGVEEPEVEGLVESQSYGEPIAIVGMTGRFPGAADLDEFWSNLCQAHDSISRFDDTDLLRTGIPIEQLDNPNYVRAKGIIEGADRFDAEFFSMTPREAESLDPQQRLALEIAVQALEDAGCDPSRFQGRIAVFAGASRNSYLQENLLRNSAFAERSGQLQMLLGNQSDSLTSRISYKLDLTGPSVNLQSACSTSLVAVHSACRALLDDQCEMALAGGVSLRFPTPSGYLYEEGGVLSPDGRCRPFDAAAQGTVAGSGGGMVALKRLSRAQADGDCVRAVIRGTCVNNDGASKAGFAAPSVEGQANAIAGAMKAAGVRAESITLVEAHGTGTPVGDPIEFQALLEAFRAQTEKGGFCALGAVKGNIGHLDAAAGIAGLIKTVLCLQNRQIPPIAHFRESNPRIDFARSPFYPAARLAPWRLERSPRRAGVSSFGMGGNNAHAILEEAPAYGKAEPSRDWKLLVLSAKSGPALEEASRRLADRLKQRPSLDLADAAFTLQIGRKAHSNRRVVLARNSEEAVAGLESSACELRLTKRCSETPRSTVFLFPGQGSQRVGMGRQLYGTESAFRSAFNECAEILLGCSGPDLRQLVYPDLPDNDRDSIQNQQALLNQTCHSQPALFAFEYALAQQLIEWGVTPTAMVGHSLGEFVAACLSGVFSLEEALRLVWRRGRLMQSMPRGAMISVPLPAAELEQQLAEVCGDLFLAAINGPSLCVASGPDDAIESLHGRLSGQGLSCRRLPVDRAFHSAMMTPAQEALFEELGPLSLKPPRIPFLSNVSGDWIRDGEATDCGYWSRQMLRSVRFSQCLERLFEDPDAVLLELGPSRLLTGFVEAHPDRPSETSIIPSFGNPGERQGQPAAPYKALAQLWLEGVNIDWEGFHRGARRRRVPLPTYPFQRLRFWVEPDQSAESRSPQTEPAPSASPANWLYAPCWRQMSMSCPPAEATGEDQWLLFVDDFGIGAGMARLLLREGSRVSQVRMGRAFRILGQDEFEIGYADAEGWKELLQTLKDMGRLPSRIVHLWSVTSDDLAESAQVRTELLDRGFFSLLWLVQAWGKLEGTPRASITVVTSNAWSVAGEGRLYPEKSAVSGLCRVIPLEYGSLKCRIVDVAFDSVHAWRGDRLQSEVLQEIRSGSDEYLTVLRAGRRWVRTFESAEPTNTSGGIRLRQGGVYLITGGLGGLGLKVAEQLAVAYQARLVLLGRTPFPESELSRRRWLEEKGEDDAVSRRIRRIGSLEEAGASVLTLRADLADRDELQAALSEARRRFGPIEGVFHCAGLAGSGLIHLKTRPLVESVLAPKIFGLRVLEELLEEDCPRVPTLVEMGRPPWGQSPFTSHGTASGERAWQGDSHRLASGKAEASGTDLQGTVTDSWGADHAPSDRIRKGQSPSQGCGSREPRPGIHGDSHPSETMQAGSRGADSLGTVTVPWGADQTPGDRIRRGQSPSQKRVAAGAKAVSLGDSHPFFVLFSSLNGLTGGIGQADYAAANAFLDAFALERESRCPGRTISIDWCGWRETGMRARMNSQTSTAHPDCSQSTIGAESRDLEISPQQGCEVLRMILESAASPQIAVSPQRLSCSSRGPSAYAPTPLPPPRRTPSADDHQRADRGTNPSRPSPLSPLEDNLAQLYRDVLGVPGVAADDGFFELGGDSVQVIRLASLARRKGLSIDPQLIFEHSTVSALARALGDQPTTPTGVSPVLAPLTLRQERWLDSAGPHWTRCAKSFALALPADADLDRCRRALHDVVSWHDALRLWPDERSRCWRPASFSPQRQVVQAETKPTSAGDEAEMDQLWAARLAQGLNPTEDSPIQAVLVRSSDGPARLIVAIHDLCVDSPSLSIVAEDFLRAYSSRADNRAARIDVRPHSFAEWLLSRFSTGVSTRHSRASWSLDSDPRIAGDRDGSQTSISGLCTRIDSRRTGSLLQEIPAVSRCRPYEILATAFIRSLQGTLPIRNQRLGIFLDARDPAHGGSADLAGAVGQLVWEGNLSLADWNPGQAAGDLADLKRRLRSLLAACDSVPATAAQGEGCHPTIEFQYQECRLNGGDIQGCRFQTIPTEQSAAQMPEGCDVGLAAVAAEGRIDIQWTFRRGRFENHQLSYILNLFDDSLLELIGECRDSVPGILTGEEFPLSGLDEANLTELFRQLGQAGPQ